MASLAHEVGEWKSKIDDANEETSPAKSPAAELLVSESDSDDEDQDEEEDFWYSRWRDGRFRLQRASEEEDANVEEEDSLGEASWPRRGGGGVTLEGYVEAVDGSVDDQRSSGGSVSRTKSLTDDDLEELKGCLDLGFGFNYEEIPELCNTLPALELCYSMSQRFLDEQHQRSPDLSSSSVAASPGDSATDHSSASPASAPIANWKISSPGDDPDEVKARLKYWAQAVACTVRLCS